MIKTLHLDIVSAESMLFSGSTRMLVAPGIDGEIGILPGHAPLLTCLRPGGVRIDVPESRDLLIYVSGGVLEAQPFTVTILADTAARARATEEEAATIAMRQVERDKEQGPRDFDYTKAKTALVQAITHVRKTRAGKERERLADRIQLG